MIWQILLFGFIIWLGYIRWTKRRLYSMASKLKNDIWTLPLVGHGYKFIGDGVDRMNSIKLFSYQAIKHGGLTSVWLGLKNYVVIVDADVLELIMKTALEKDDMMRFLRIVLGNGTIFAPVSIWRPRRKILAPTFSPKNLNNFIQIFSKQSSTMMDHLEEAPKGNFSIWNYLTTYTMDSVCETTLGICINAQKNRDQPFLKAFDKFTQMAAIRMVRPWLHLNCIYQILGYEAIFMNIKKTLCDFVDQVIKSKKEAHKEITSKNIKSISGNVDITEIQQKTFLELIMESSGGAKGYSDIELQEETLVIVMAGTDTSAVGSSFTALMLSKHQDVQENVYQELQEVFGDSDRPIVAGDLTRLKYLDAVIRETLRLHPPVPLITRKIEKDITLPSGLTLVGGTGIIVSIWGVQRNPQYWGSDAEEFRPERFLDSTLKNQSAFMAFSCGPRNCLGYQYAMMSMKTAMASLVRRYRLLPESDTDLSHPDSSRVKPIRDSFDIMMRDADKFTLQIKRR